jgi:DNA (cytosine-5)-methyltransferase 1
MKLNMIDLFSGCGGLTDGFMQTGKFQTLAAVDWEPPAVDTLRKRLSSKWKYKKTDRKVFHFDMQRTSELIHGWDKDDTYQEGEGLQKLVGRNKVDVIVGGPPCQAYSIAGRIRDKNGMHDDYRNYLFESYIEVVKTFKPKVCIFENVQGMLSASPGGISIIERVTEAFSLAGYYVTTDLKKAALFDTSDFGIPQKRIRVIIIAINKDKFKDYEKRAISFYKKLNSFKTSNVATVQDAIGCLPKIFPHKKVEKRVSHYIEPNSKYFNSHEPRFHNSRDIEIFKLLANDIQSGQNKYVHSDDLRALYTQKTGKTSAVHKYHVLRQDRPSNTIPAHLFKDGLRHIHPDPKQARSITVREAARLQTFDDDYDFLGANGAKYKMIGNAVPPKLARCIAISVQHVLE